MFFLKKKKIPFQEIVPNGYVDIHSHLIAGIDDGVETVYQSAYILEKLLNLGFSKVITTPHSMLDVWPNTSSIIVDKYNYMLDVLKALKIRDIKFQVSSEYMLDDFFLKNLKNKEILPLQGNYILVEMSTFNAPMNLKEMLFQIKVAGLKPILAHPERYHFYHNDFDKYTELKEEGFFFQLNLLSANGHYGPKVLEVTKRLLKEGYYDFTGSDIHNYGHLEELEEGFTSKTSNYLNNLMQNNSTFK